MTGTALVTGGQQGIGLRIGRAHVAAGFRVVIASERAPDDPAVEAALAALGPAAHYLRHDIADTAAISALLRDTERLCGAVTTLVSNAGVGAPVRQDMLALTPESFDFVHQINLRGTFFLAQAVAARMLETGDSAGYQSLLFVTSASAEMVSVERAEYCMSKAGAAMMCKLFAARLAKAGIGVFELRPGIITSGMTDAVRDAYTPRIEGGLVPAGRWGEPADIGKTVVPLARGEMRFSTGSMIAVDGGLSIPRL